MSSFTTLFQDSVQPFVHSVVSRLRQTPTQIPVLAPQISTMPESISAAEYLKAVKRCRRDHKFYFLDLPKSIRRNIYTALFSDSTIQVCSWLKEHTGPFAETERCQILLTCRAIATEASGYQYFYTRWKFKSSSSLLYFTWHDVHPARWRNVTMMTLTRVDILPDFITHLPKFEGLRTLTIDEPTKFRIKVAHRPKKAEQRKFVRYLLNTFLYANFIAPYVYIPRTWEFCLTVRILYDRQHEEILLVNMDRQQLRHKYYPIVPEIPGPTVDLPSATDDDAEFLVVGETQGWDYEWA